MCLGPLGELLLVVFRLIDGILDASQTEPPPLCLVGRRKPCREVTKRSPQTQQRGPMGDLPFVALGYGAVLAAGPPAPGDKLFGLQATEQSPPGAEISSGGKLSALGTLPRFGGSVGLAQWAEPQRSRHCLLQSRR